MNILYILLYNYNVKFLDMDCKKLNCDDLDKYIQNKFIPDVVIISYDYHIPLHTQKALENISTICKKLKEYDIKTIVIGMPYNMNGTSSERVEITKKFIHKLNCKFPKIDVVEIDERLTTVAAHKTMNFLDVNKNKKRSEKIKWI